MRFNCFYMTYFVKTELWVNKRSVLPWPISQKTNYEVRNPLSYHDPNLNNGVIGHEWVHLYMTYFHKIRLWVKKGSVLSWLISQNLNFEARNYQPYLDLYSKNRILRQGTVSQSQRKCKGWVARLALSAFRKKCWCPQAARLFRRKPKSNENACA